MTAPLAAGTRRTPVGQLSAHELAVVVELARGGTHNRIGRRLGISPSAVSTTINRASRRLGTDGPAHLVAVAIGLGLIRPDVAIRRAGRSEAPRGPVRP